MKKVEWFDDVWVAFDTETTGVNPQEARILEAAIVTHDPEGILTEEDRVIYIDPSVEISAEASKVHGLTAEKLATLNPMTAKGGIEAVNTILHCRSVNRGYPLVIYNAPYDYVLLMAECSRHGIRPGDRPMFLDPLVIDRAADKYRKGSRKLEDTAKFYGVKMDGAAHGAQADARAALGIMRALVVKYPDLKKCSLAQIQNLQVKWYSARRDHLNEYWASIGKTERVNGSWPIGEAPAEMKGAA